MLIAWRIQLSQSFPSLFQAYMLFICPKQFQNLRFQIVQLLYYLFSIILHHESSLSLCYFALKAIFKRTGFPVANLSLMAFNLKFNQFKRFFVILMYNSVIHIQQLSVLLRFRLNINEFLWCIIDLRECAFLYKIIKHFWRFVK